MGTFGFISQVATKVQLELINSYHPLQESGILMAPYVVEVFGIPLLTTSKFAQASEDGRNKLQHVASIVAELIDNDNDGCADDPNVLAKLLKPYQNMKNTFILQDKVEGGILEDEQFILQLEAAGLDPYPRLRLYDVKLNKKSLHSVFSNGLTIKEFAYSNFAFQIPMRET